MAAVMAHKDTWMIGVDVNPAYVAAIQQGHAPLKEGRAWRGMTPGNRERLSATTITKSGAGTDATFIIVPHPPIPMAGSHCAT